MSVGLTVIRNWWFDSHTGQKCRSVLNSKNDVLAYLHSRITLLICLTEQFEIVYRSFSQAKSSVLVSVK